MGSSNADISDDDSMPKLVSCDIVDQFDPISDVTSEIEEMLGF